MSENGTLVISVDRHQFGILPGPLEHNGRVFKPKQETHITVFGSTTGAAVRTSVQGDAGITATAAQQHVAFDMKGMKTFYDELKALGVLARDLPVPPPHVTLYTSNCDTGIGVHSEDELERLTRTCLDEKLRPYP